MSLNDVQVMEGARVVYNCESKWRLVHERESKWHLIVRVVNFTDLHRTREENYRAKYTNARILYKKIRATWIKSKW